jgi:hypothetical protein
MFIPSFIVHGSKVIFHVGKIRGINEEGYHNLRDTCMEEETVMMAAMYILQR